MSSFIYRMDKKRAVISILVGILCSVGLEMSITKVITPANTEIDQLTGVTEFFRTIYLSLNGDRFSTFLMAIGIGILIYFSSRIKHEKGLKITLIIVSVLFALGQVTALSFDASDSSVYIWGSGLNFSRALYKGIVYGVVFYYGLKFLFDLLNKFGIQKEFVKEKTTWTNSLIICGLFLIAWLPYFVIFFPGTANTDTVIQLMQSFGIKSYINDLTTIKPPITFYTNHHPFLTTLLFEAFFKLGLNVFGNITIGVAIYTIFHMVVSAVVFTVALQYLRFAGVTRNRRLVIQLVIMFIPIFPMYAICMLKDTWYALFSLLLVILMAEIARTKGKAFSKWWFDVLFALNSLGLMLTKNYGFYVIIIVGIIYLVIYRKEWWKILISVGVPTVLYRVLWVAILLPLLNVAPVGKQEALSVPFQQTARYVVEHGDEVTEEEKEAINKVLPYKSLAKYYRPDLSDYIKEEYKQNASSTDLNEYFKTWAMMFFKHPLTYVEATVNNTYEYWDIDKISNLVYYEFEPYLQKHDPNKEYEHLYVTNFELMKNARFVVNQMMLSFEKIPFINIFMSMGFLPWIVLVMVVYSIYKKKKDYIMLNVMPVIVYAICLVSPDNGNSRYIMPVIYSILFIAVLLLLPEDKGIEGESKCK